MMNKFPLTLLQQSYLAGRYKREQLGGVPCHVYMELDSGRLTPAAVKEAWSRVVKAHPLLMARLDGDCFVPIERSPNEAVAVIDLREAQGVDGELSQIREAFAQRRLHLEKGHSCGLLLTLLPKGHQRLHFDYDLLAGDVAGFQNILKDLEEALKESPKELPVRGLPEEGPPCVDREADWTFWREEAGKLPCCPALPLAADPQKLWGVVYEALRFDLPVRQWAMLKERAGQCRLSPYTAVLMSFGEALMEETGQDRILLSVPDFSDATPSAPAVYDRTRLFFLPLENGGEDTFVLRAGRLEAQRRRQGRHMGISAADIQGLIQEKQAGTSFTAPVVFSATPDFPLLPLREEPVFDGLEYLVSQTPQVFLDAQIYEVNGGLSSIWMTPKGLFDGGALKRWMKAYQDRLIRLAESEWK